MAEMTDSCEETEVLVRPLIVDIYAYREGDDVLFTLAWKNDGDAKRKQGWIDIPPRQPATPIHFHLHDRTGLRLSFLSPCEEAIWVDLDDCPRGKGNGGQIEYDSVAPKQLKVTDLNEGPACTLHYALRFNGESVGDGPPYEFDPEIRNGGSGSS